MQLLSMLSFIQISDEFVSINAAAKDVHLRDSWRQVQDGIMRRATDEATKNSDLNDLLGSIEEEWDDG